MSTSTPQQTLLARVWQHIQKRELKPAMAACNQLNQQFPDYSNGWHATSFLAQQIRNYPIALRAINKAVALEPANNEWLLQQASCLLDVKEIEKARKIVLTLADRPLTTALQYQDLGLLLSRLELQPQALQQYLRAIELDPNNSEIYYNLAVVQRFLGDLSAAKQSLDQAVSLNKLDYEAQALRSSLSKQTPETNHIDELGELLDKEKLSPQARVHIHYALAKELEDIGEAEKSFQSLQQGSSIRRSHMEYSVDDDIAVIDRLIETYTEDSFTTTHSGDDNAEAIFIIGLPRTGTTLVERIIGSHSKVFAAGELSNFSQVMMAATKLLENTETMGRLELVAQTQYCDFKSLGQSYIESTRPFTGHCEKFIDKMPLNFLYAGLIHRALPNAKIINLRRHPMDTCYAVYKQLFKEVYPFSYDLDELAQYYIAYDRLMAHWNKVMPGVIHTVNYEDVVADISTESQRLINYCGLEWEEQCLDFQNNQQASTTASASQVRQPVYQSSVGKWRRYEQQLEPVATLLQQAGIVI